MGVLIGIYIGLGLTVAICSFLGIILGGGSRGPVTLFGCILLALVYGIFWPISIFFL